MAVARVPFIAGNWKMNLDHQQAIAFVQKLHWALKEAKHLDGSVEVGLFPPFTDLRTVQTLLDADKIPFALGAQDLSTKDSGAYTGEVSGAFLKKLNCTYVIIGHSERREYHAETDEVVADEGAGGPAARARAGHLRGRDLRGPGEVRRERRSRRAARDRAGGRSRGRRHRGRLRAGLGDRLGSGGHARAGAGGLREAARRSSPTSSVRMPRTARASCTADR